MDLIGSLVMRSPILWLGRVLLFFRVLLFLAEKPFIAFSGIPGRSISRFHFLGFYLGIHIHTRTLLCLIPTDSNYATLINSGPTDLYTPAKMS
jgi:hypothetical protein